MIIEEKFPEKFKSPAYHPSLFIYAWKRNGLDKLFEEIMASNIAILGGEVWLVEGEKTLGIIPLKSGDKEVLSWKIIRQKGEEWYDFVERSVKETLEIISEANLEKKVTAATRHKIWYHFDFSLSEGV